MSPTEKSHERLIWSLLELNPFAVQFRYELAGEAFPSIEQLARLTERLLAHVRFLLATG